MNRILLAAICGLLLSGMTFAQNQIPSGTAAQPQTANPSNSQQIPDSSSPHSQSQPATQTPDSQAHGQPTAGTNANTAGHPMIAPGSVIPVELTKTIDAKKAKAGEEVVAKVTQDMKTSSGDILLPKDTKILGHVTEAQARSKQQKESQMAIAFDRAVMKDGNKVDLPMSIQAIIGQQQPANQAAGGEDQGSTAAPSGMGSGGASGGRPGVGAAPTPSASASSSPSSDSGSNNQAAKNARPQITGQTQGVIGISNLSLSSGPNGNQGSVMTSEKNNVKLESGTMLLLKVNQ